MRINRHFAGFWGLLWLFAGAAACILIIVVLQRGEPVTELHGDTRVLDGDSILVAGQTVRLNGLDAPEYDQICRDAEGADWVCGTAAREALSDLVAGRAVDCAGVRRDHYGRLLAACHVGETDLGAELVRRGLAVAREDYLSEQAEARSRGAGIWTGEFDDPADWRRRQEMPPGGTSLMELILGMFTS